MKLRLTKHFTIEMAHALPAYDGKCAGIHGHSYHLSVTVESQASPAADGLVMDFALLKHIVQQHVVDPFDHALVLPQSDKGHIDLGPYNAKLIQTPFQPSTENLLLHFAALVEPHLPAGVALHSITLAETDTSTAELVVG
ncbi:MAG: 6-carboxytetrahydropterin synthase [Bacteroidales bacterium]|nr:6-carboxytetrahydropterin synthase [Bacteroidales bacterium]